MGLPSIVIFFGMLGLLVFVHELGHFLAAKSVGVAVEEFAFGFGPRLVTLFRRGGTEYTIHALPLGGFVNLVGMQPEDVHMENGLMSKPAWARAFVFLAGPLMNVLLAILILCSMGLLTGLPTGQLSNEVVEVHKDTEAARVGLQTGDKIIRLDDQKLTSGNELIEAIESHPGKQVLLTVERGGKTLQVEARPTPEMHLVPSVYVEAVEPNGPAGKLGLKPGDQLVAYNGLPIYASLQRLQSRLEPSDPKESAKEAEPFTLTVRRGTEELLFNAKGQLSDLTPRGDESPLAKKLQLQRGDQLTAVDEKRVRSADDLAAVLRAAGDRPVTLTVQRGGAAVKLPPQRVPLELTAAEQVRTVGKMGFLPGHKFRDRVDFAQSVSAGWDQFLGFFVQLYGQAADGKLAKNAGSVVTMYRATDMYSKLPPGYMMSLIANLSLSLAVFNLLPIPVLDGGHLALLSVEVIRRRRLGPAAYRLATAIGFAVVVLAFVLLMYLDVVRLRSGTPLINL